MPVDIASLVVFRIAFGGLMFWELSRYFTNGWLGAIYAAPTFRFAYFGFGWLPAWSPQGMYLHFIALEVLALLIAVGYLYRVSTALFFLGFAYMFLLDQANYLNHFYLILLVSLLLNFVPAHRAFAVDAWMRPRLRSPTVPAWTLWLLMAQVGIVYFFGGLAKLNGDWLRGEPMRMWLADKTDFPLLGRFFDEEWMVYLFTYGGLLLDLFAVPFLLWRRTRLAAFAFVLFFHLSNVKLFNIGVFPWFMIAATLLFFPPWWPRAVLRFLRPSTLLHPATWPRTARRAREVARRFSGWLRIRARERGPDPDAPGIGRYVVVGLLAGYLAVQVLVPLRHHLYPGNVNWTEEGHRFSWRMMLRTKDVQVGFFVTDPQTGERQRISPLAAGLTAEQMKEMPMRPDMILQFAHHLDDRMRQRGRGDMEVRVIAMASLNGRDYQRMIKPRVDLSAEPRSLAKSDWIVPLKRPLNPSE